MSKRVYKKVSKYVHNDSLKCGPNVFTKMCPKCVHNDSLKCVQMCLQKCVQICPNKNIYIKGV